MKLLSTLNGLEYMFVNGRLLVKDAGLWKLSGLDEGNHIATLSKIQDMVNDGLMQLL